MENWRRVVTTTEKEPSETCAFWAKAHLDYALSNEMNLALSLGIDLPSVNSFSNDDKDGWLVEAAVNRIPNPEMRRYLRMRYVWNWKRNSMRQVFGLRGPRFGEFGNEAEKELKNILTRIRI